MLGALYTLYNFAQTYQSTVTPHYINKSDPDIMPLCYLEIMLHPLYSSYSLNLSRKLITKQ